MKQNDDKTEFPIIGTPIQLKRWILKIYTFVKQKFLHLNKHLILVSIFDKEMNSKAQINNISKEGYYHVET